MLTRRRVLAAVLVALCLLAGVTFAVAQRRDGGTGTGTAVDRVADQPAIPAGWTPRPVGTATMSVPEGWTSASNSNDITLATWVSPSTTTGLPARCVVQKRPLWLLTFRPNKNDWLGALRRDLTSISAVTGSRGAAASVGPAQALRVHGAVAALAFTATVTDRASGGRLDTADLLAAEPDGTETHVFCSGPPGSLPAHLAAGVDSFRLS